ncbi:hypothetical protein SNK04_014240 [Fusarium graminearum]
MLEGNRILQQKGDIKFPIPPDKDFRTAFTDATGQLFAGRPGAADVAMQAVAPTTPASLLLRGPERASRLDAHAAGNPCIAGRGGGYQRTWRSPGAMGNV